MSEGNNDDPQDLIWRVLLGETSAEYLPRGLREEPIGWWGEGRPPPTAPFRRFLARAREDGAAGMLPAARTRALACYERKRARLSQKQEDDIKAIAEAKRARLVDKNFIPKPSRRRNALPQATVRSIDPARRSLYLEHRGFVWSLLQGRREPSTKAQKEVMAWWRKAFRPRTPQQHDIENGILAEFRDGRLSADEAAAWRGFVARRAARDRRMRSAVSSRFSRGAGGGLPRCVGEP